MMHRKSTGGKPPVEKVVFHFCGQDSAANGRTDDKKPAPYEYKGRIGMRYSAPEMTGTGSQDEIRAGRSRSLYPGG